MHSGAGVDALADLKGKPISLSGIARLNYWPWLKGTLVDRYRVLEHDIEHEDLFASVE
jgi:hypothetical protein